MIKITDQNEMIEMSEIFLHQETTLTQSDVNSMDDFDKYYEGRELLKDWNKLPKEQLENKMLGLEVMGINFEVEHK
jgi:hypothetical protein